MELSYKSKKIELSIPAMEWIAEIIKYHDISIIDLNIYICIKSTQLPAIHNDPCDRFIIATYLLYNIPVCNNR